MPEAGIKRGIPLLALPSIGSDGMDQSKEGDTRLPVCSILASILIGLYVGAGFLFRKLLTRGGLAGQFYHGALLILPAGIFLLLLFLADRYGRPAWLRAPLAPVTLNRTRGAVIVLLAAAWVSGLLVLLKHKPGLWDHGLQLILVLGGPIFVAIVTLEFLWRRQDRRTPGS